ncbi:major facilitator superfamily transporter [Paucilactobacillus hokkaidonensis JCM 18461]|uniref:Major facilitator superfamily transporter n=2 Tax=Paucilactobacillus hokkaidonensis TaxID=1193095 RepID=A0A0A1GRZ1_9LACO|nr:MFS transporter [Paucilactobacillus hokkaidonensis]KRO09857.1 multidrug resistance protein [Paucilactobacillus hokkaidonensis]BAP84745.1 major facilitator superfamily transporter [Paucilactobacillus hokkaidonensis JCM 18461]
MDSRIQPTWKKNIGYFLAAQNFFLFGSSSVYFAILWYIALQTSSGTWIMLATMATTLPQILISLWAGIWADQYSRKKLIIFSSSFVTLFTFGTALLYFFEVRSLWLLLLIAAIRSLGSGVQTPAGNALLPEITPKIELSRINGLNQFISSALLLISPILSGLILGKLGIIFIFVVDLITATTGIILMSLVHVYGSENKITTHSAVLPGIWDGIKFTFSRQYLRNFMLFIMGAFILVAPSSQLSTLFVKRTFGSGVWRLTLNELLWTIGALLGSLYITTHKKLPNKIKLITVGFIGSGISFAVMGIPEPFWVYLLFMFFSGICMPIIQASANILIQENIPANKMGRVFSILQILSTGIYPIAMLVYGPLSDQIAIKYILIATGLLLILLGFIFNKRLLSLTDKLHELH